MRTLVWFRGKDLRVADHAPLCEAADAGWSAGCGDAQPYFRIFNPVTQDERFDPEGDYVRHWVPELARMPARYVHRPWEAPESVLRAA